MIDTKPVPLTARSGGPLRGQVRVPGDKSISHRALIIGALATGETAISGLLEGEDVLHTGTAMQALGAQVARTGEGAWRVHGVGVGGLSEPAAKLDFGNSGTGCRLIMGAVAGCPITAVFDGDSSLRRRPMKRILDPIALFGAKVVQMAEGGRLPVTLQGRARSDSGHLPDPDAVGAGQIGGSAGRARCSGRNRRDRERGEPRPYRAVVARTSVRI